MGTENNDVDSGVTDIDATVADMASDLGLGIESPDDGSATPTPDSRKAADDKVVSPTNKQIAAGDTAKPGVITTPAPRSAPKSWPKETHEYWGKLDPKVQDLVELREKNFLDGIEQYKGDAGFAKTIRDTFAPYQALLTAQNITDPAVAVKGLMNAHYQLSSSDESVRTGFMANLLKQYRIDPAKLVEASDKPIVTDPALDHLTAEVNTLKAARTSEQEKQLNENRTRVAAEVDAFEADPAHPYFKEVSHDMVLLLQDPKIDLAEAYKRAVRANPITWAKEEARMKAEFEASYRKDAEEKAKAARKARGTNVEGRESTKTPTEILGSIEDTLRETHREIVSRT